ncbi:MAG: hypothetical protein LBK56_06150 [Gracilibacteraceae bacterium]|jgi:hypothetical protein|nr:hypothetical protein [Gracilibacteraceae bacterium]
MRNNLAAPNPFGEVDINTLADIQEVVIDMSLPLEERRKSYLRQIKNPRLYRCGDTVVRVSFADNGSTLKDRLKQYLLQGIKL